MWLVRGQVTKRPSQICQRLPEAVEPGRRVLEGWTVVMVWARETALLAETVHGLDLVLAFWMAVELEAGPSYLMWLCRCCLELSVGQLGLGLGVEVVEELDLSCAGARQMLCRWPFLQLVSSQHML